MSSSKVSAITSQIKAVQLPLKGFRVPLTNEKGVVTAWLEGMGDGRFRVHTPVNKK